MHFVNPNYHVILIHYPLGVFMLGVAIELFGCLWKQSSVRVAARWMILIGGLAMLPAATSGIYALSDATSAGVSADQAHMLRVHTWVQSIATLLATFTAIFMIAASDGWRRRSHGLVLSVLVICAGLMASGAWFGGETVYTQGTAVRFAAPNASQAKPKLWSAEWLIYYIGEPEQIHMILAGVTFALAFAALGLSIRKITAEYPDDAHLPLISEAPSDDVTPSTPGPAYPNSPLPILAPSDAPETCIPAGCFWLVGALLALLTLAAGYWIWANGSSSWSPQAFWNELMVYRGKLIATRSAVHVWVGVTLLVLTLLLAALSRWAPQQRTVLAIFASLLVLAIAAQVWLGVLLQFDGGDGPLYRFTPAGKISASNG
jgi:uncharacterized membrane protein